MMSIKDIKVMNTGKPIPDSFFVFPGRYSQRLPNRIENRNIKLRKGALVSSGMSRIFLPEIRELYLKGDIDYAPFVPNEGISPGAISPFLDRLIERYRLEYNLELYRKCNCKTYPSRFSCLYAFGSYEDCEKEAGKRKGENGWDIKKVKEYKLADLGDLNCCIKIAKANFKMIGFLEHYPYAFLSCESQNVLYNHYWNAQGELTIPATRLGEEFEIPENKCGVIYEYLIEGVLEEV